MARDHAALWADVSQRRAHAGAPALGSARLKDPRSHALESFEAGVARALGRRPSRAGALLDFFKRTDFYRDLPLRRLLPEGARKTIERMLRRPSYDGARGKARP
jgi:hypothetical protein